MAPEDERLDKMVLFVRASVLLENGQERGEMALEHQDHLTGSGTDSRGKA